MSKTIKNSNVFNLFVPKQNVIQNKILADIVKNKKTFNIRTYFAEQSKSIEQEHRNKITLDHYINNESFRKNYTETNNSKISKLEFIKNKYKILF